ncbi:MAG: ATP-binding protein [Vicinamibacteraceae bacterium]
MSPLPAALDAIVITPTLFERVAPPRDLAVEHGALTDLISQAATQSSQLLAHLVDLAVRLCNAGSAGVSLLEPAAEPGEGVFRWVAMAGAYREYVGGTTPESFSPCGVCLTRGAPQLYHHPARVFTYLAEATPPIVEGLVIPLRSEAGPLGTIWIVSHTEARQFTARDLAVMQSLADFTSTALALQRDRDQAEAASRAKDEFLAVVSHELRRPLTAIVGWSELLLAGRASAVTAARAIEALYTNARRQQGMIEDLLDASRAYAGTLRLNDAEMDLAAVVRSAIEVVADRAVDGGVELIVTIPTSLPFRGDPGRLHQILGNLVGNAVKFTPAGGRVMVDVETAPPWVTITVRDTGIGIAPDMLRVVFDVFRQAEASSTRRDTGLGLGLTIARRLVALHDGTLKAHSDGEGRGAVFTVRLPAARLLDRAAPRDPSRVRQTRHRELSGITILVVDDELDVRDVLACVLEDLGATVITAADVTGARAALARHTIDVLLTDVGMPGQDGFDLLAHIGGDASTRPAATIAVTALASAPERQRVLAAGFDHHIAKPVDFDALVRLIIASSRPETVQ